MINTLPKSLTITFVAVSILIAGLTVDLVGAQNTAAVTTSDLPQAELPPSKYLCFGHLTTEDGLSNDTIWGIAQDSHGFIWFGTFSGLNRYDGSDIKVYRHDPDDPFSLSGDAVRGLLKDSSGVLWIGTWNGGLNQFDPSTERFIS
jgi:ligand-binding sensor domain-containing protein